MCKLDKSTVKAQMRDDARFVHIARTRQRVAEHRIGGRFHPMVRCKSRSAKVPDHVRILALLHHAFLFEKNASIE